MLLLALDTSTFIGTVAVVRDGELLAEWSASVRATHGETLLPHVARAVELAGVELGEIDAFAVGIGPGSFTGVRIGVATAKGLALAQQKPIVGVSSLRILARGFGVGGGVVAPLLDAHKGEVYAALYGHDAAGELVELLAPFNAPPEVAAARLVAAAHESPLWFAGSGLARYEGELTRALGVRAQRAPKFCDAPRAACLAHEAALRLLRGAGDDLAALAPLYLRDSDAKLPKQSGG
jgi:tRNA threonylcarbamoyladenosine biosynthesis protein TsaB